MDIQTATFGGGCFWCLEPVFADLKGVASAVPGYSGGHRPDPSYEEVCSGTTGHAESVQITFDPDEISYRDLIEVFFAVHDPTTLNRQGEDIGTQYRSVVFYHGEEQQQEAQAVIAGLSRDASWQGPSVVTDLVPFEVFYPAEEYHRDYFNRNPGKGYCRIVIAPKLQKFRKRFSARIAETAQ